MLIQREEPQAGVVRLTINRADKRNALSQDLIAELRTAVDAVANDDAARLLVLTGAGPVFSAGMDLGEMQARAAEPNAHELWQQDAQGYRELLAALFQLTIPTLAVVQGPALAGGLGLVLACDLVLAADAAFFSLPEPQRGITAAIVSPFLAYRIGAGRATYMLLSERKVLCEEALRWGLVHEAAGEGELETCERELCRSILTGAPGALAATKAHLLATVGQSVMDQIDAAMSVSATARETPDAAEGLAAFLEKRRPAWFPKSE